MGLVIALRVPSPLMIEQLDVGRELLPVIPSSRLLDAGSCLLDAHHPLALSDLSYPVCHTRYRNRITSLSIRRQTLELREHFFGQTLEILLQLRLMHYFFVVHV